MPRKYSSTQFVWAAACTVAIAANLIAQPAPRSQVSGTITAIDPAARTLTLKSDKGDSVDVTASEKTLVLRIPPGETDPKKGSRIELSALAAGDRAVIVGPAPEGNHWNATAVLAMTRGDIATVQQKEQEDWKKRGTSGTVTATDTAANSVTIKSGSHVYTVQAGPKTTWQRYSPDSARFADARPSTLAEIKNGDQLRVLGNKGEDGSTIQAEKVVFGTFRQLAATVTAVDAAKGEITVKDLATKKNLAIQVQPDSTMRKLPEQMARMLARRYSPGAASETAAPAPAAGGGRGPGGGGDINQMLDRLPAMTLSELKPGDAVMISSTQGSEPGRVSAIMLLAGVEPLLTASPNATRDIMGGWNLGGGGETGQ